MMLSSLIVHAIAAPLALYGLIAVVGHILGLKAWHTHPIWVIPAITLLGVYCFAIPLQLLVWAL